VKSGKGKSEKESRVWRLIDRALSGQAEALNDLLGDEEVRSKAKVISICLLRGIEQEKHGGSDDLAGLLCELRLHISTFNGGDQQEFWRWLWALARQKPADDKRSVHPSVTRNDALKNTELSPNEKLCRRMIIDVWWDSLDNELRVILASRIAHVRGGNTEPLAGQDKSASEPAVRRAQKDLVAKLQGASVKTASRTRTDE
jgi:hypothetical protein